MIRVLVGAQLVEDLTSWETPVVGGSVKKEKRFLNIRPLGEHHKVPRILIKGSFR